MSLATNQDLDPGALRQAFGIFPTGVVAIAAMVDGQPVGLAASSFTTVSLDPPLVSINVAKTSKTWPDLRRAQHLGVTVLADHHGVVCRQLAGPVDERFTGLAVTVSPDCAVTLDEGLAQFDCTIYQEVDAGDHVLVLLELHAVQHAVEGYPLVFHRSGFGRLVQEPCTPQTGAAPAVTDLPRVVPESLTVDGVRRAARPVLDDLRASAVRREQERDHAYEEVSRLTRTGITLVSVPQADGGAGGGLRDLLDAVIDIARADSNVAQALRGTFGTAWTVTRNTGQPGRAETIARLAAGHVFAGTVNERTGGASGTVNARLERDGDGWVVTGDKYYSTGSVYASWFSGTALTEDGTLARFRVPTSRAGVEVLDDFDAIGQRLTSSGTTRLRGVRLSADEVDLGDGPAPANPWGGLGHIYLCAVQAGIAHAVLDDALWFAREKARPIKHSGVERSVDDPYVQHVVGEIAAGAHAVRSAVLVAGEVLESVADRPDEEVRAAGAEASITIAQTQAFAARTTLRSAELLFDVGSGSATARELGFDRHWRNARVVANHNPRDWKLAKAGAWRLTGEEPPTTGLF